MIEKKSTRAGKIVVYFFLILWALIVLFPFYWMLLTSVKSYGSYNAEYIPTFFTLTPTLENYSSVFTAVPLGRYLLNTLIFTVATTGLMMLVIIPAAFAFARLEFVGKNAVFALFLSLMMIPTELVIITNFVTVTNLNLRNTQLGLILPSVTSVFYIYLLKENFAQIPDELYKDCPQYVPALHSDQVNSLTKVSTLSYCKRKMWMGMDGKKGVGRICGMINPRYNDRYDKKRARFGWFDTINDIEVARF